MAKSSGTMHFIGKWAFLIGVILAIIFGFVGMNNYIAIVLLVIGLIVGFLNVTHKETTPFLLSGVVLVIVSALGGSAFSSVPAVAAILSALLLIFVPATVIVAVKNVWAIARD